MYRFQWAMPSKCLGLTAPLLDVIHALELPCKFGTVNVKWVAGGKALGTAALVDERRLANQMMDAWTDFARDGDPNGKTA